MAIGGDPGDLRAHARDLRARADTVEASLPRAGDPAHPQWHSTAADRFRDTLGLALSGSRLSIDELRDAADEFDRLATELEQRQDELATLLAQAGKTMEDAARMIAGGVTDIMGEAQGLASRALDEARDFAGDVAEKADPRSWF